MKCPKCEKVTKQHKIGFTKAGSQRYRCYVCKYSYTPTKKPQGYSQAIRQKAIQLYIDGAGLRRTARQVGVHHQTVANWAKEQSEQLPEVPVPTEVKAAEFDGIFTFIGDKKTNLSHYACRSRNSMLFGLESGLGAFKRADTGYY